MTGYGDASLPESAIPVTRRDCAGFKSRARENRPKPEDPSSSFRIVLRETSGAPVFDSLHRRLLTTGQRKGLNEDADRHFHSRGAPPAPTRAAVASAHVKNRTSLTGPSQRADGSPRLAFALQAPGLDLRARGRGIILKSAISITFPNISPLPHGDACDVVEPLFAFRRQEVLERVLAERLADEVVLLELVERFTEVAGQLVDP